MVYMAQLIQILLRIFLYNLKVCIVAKLPLIVLFRFTLLTARLTY